MAEWIPFAELAVAQAAAQALLDESKSPLGTTLLYVYGLPGTGKTAFCNHLCAQYIARYPEQSVQSISAIDLGRRYQETAPDHRFELKELLKTDLLIIEDLQYFIAPLGDHLAASIDKRLRRNRPTIITGRDAPGDVPTTKKLISRLIGSANVEMRPPSEASQGQLIDAILDRQEIKLSKAIKQRLIGPGKSIRELLGDLQRVAQLYAQYGRVEIAHWEATQPTLESNESTTSIERIIAIVAEYYRLAPKALKGESRVKGVVLGRQVAMHFARAQGETFATIGQAFGRRDHKTVLHSCQKVESLRLENAAFAKELTLIREKLIREGVMVR